ncbi:hypothetical protein GCM10027452_38130 [Micromonospora halotolerans]
MPLAEVVRSGFVEGFHRGSVAVLDAAGAPVSGAGDPTSPVFPRSSNKPMQAIGMLRAGLPLTDPADVALVWLLSRPGVTAPIVGPRTMDQLDRNLGALAVRLDETTLEKLDELFPPVGNGGPGPEAWAW